jgi:hypothetical protein
MQAEAGVFEPRQEPSCVAPAGAPHDGAQAACGAPGRALVPLGPAAPHAPRTGLARYPGAAFLAHLIAVHRRLPQTRPRGRAAPEDVAAVYGAAQNPPPARTGRRLRCSA